MYLFRPLLAFGFASPLMLWGLAAASIPIVIHLLHRRRFQTVQWAAMRFLLAATKKQSRRIKLEQILLLLIRTLILTCLALALSRPTAETLGEYFQSAGPKHRIVVVDSTYSMGYSAAGRTRFDRAKDMARQIVSRAKQGDAINLVRISDSVPHVMVRRPAYQSAAVIEEIDQLTLFDERVDASIVLKEIDELLSLAPDLTHKEVYFITDLQSATWGPPDSTETLKVREAMKKIAVRAKIVWLDVGEPNATNVAVTGLKTDESFALSGRPIRVSASIKNFNSVGATGQLVELTLDGQLADTRRVDLPAGQEVTVDFAPSFSGGEHRLKVRISPDALPVDDSRSLVIPVREELQVLLVNGKPSGELMGNSTDFLKLALSPELPNRAIASSIQPTVIREIELLGTDLSRFDCVFICNVAMFTEREAEVLRRYLDAGGGVVFCLGDQVRADNYNQILHRDKQPILPATLGERIGDTKKKEVAFEFNAGDFNHPIVSPFQGNTGAGLELTKTFVYIKAVVDEDRSAKVALRFSSGDPAIIDAPSGRGRVILFTTSVDREWSTWAVWGHSLIPLIHETVNYAVSDRWKDREVLVGQPLQCHVGLRATDTSATHQLPDGDSKPLQPSEDGRILITEPTTTSGFHKLGLGPPANRTDWYAVNVDPVESDLTSLRVEDLRTEMMPGVDFSYLTEWEESSSDAGEKVRAISTGTGFSRALLITALALLLVEQMMAWKFIAGVSLLLAILLSTLTWNVWHWNSLAGAMIAFLIAICVFAVAMKYRNRFGSVNW
ncbi:MAG: BatA domain-containing protein [Schlesneria sp.]